MRRMVLVLAALVLATAPAVRAWTWPIEGAVLRPFVFGPDPYAAGQHRGITIAGDLGSPVRAPATGTVSFAGTVPGSGKVITIQTSDGYSVTLVHLGAIDVAKGGAVGEGDVVAAVGWSGTPEVDVTSVFLGIRRTADPQGYLDPLG